MRQYLDDTFLTYGRGFQFTMDPPSSIADSSNLQSRDSWTVLGCALARAQLGDMAALTVLPSVMRRDNAALVWNGCVQLIGFAGSWQLVMDTARFFLAVPTDQGVQWEISTLLLNACTLSAVEPLLTLHQAAAEDDARLHVEHCISMLLEDDPRLLADGPEKSEVPDPDYPEGFGETILVRDDAGYAAKVRATAARIKAKLTAPDHAIVAGESLDLRGLVRRLYGYLGAAGENKRRIEWIRMFFEASTGIDCSRFYENNRFQRLAAMAIFEDFLDSEAPKRFEVGTRYFFGHPLKP